MTDLSELKILQLSEERFRRLFETARDGILLLDAVTGKIVEANPYMSEITGYPRNEILGRFIWDLGFVWDVAEAKEKFLELQQTDFVRYENLPFKTKAGATRHVEFVSNVYLVDGTRVIQCNIRDISQRVTAEELAANLLSMYRTISRCNVALVHATDEVALVATICRVLVEESKLSRAWVGFTVAPKENRMKPIAAFSKDGDYLSELRVAFDRELIEDGPVAIAINTQRTIISQDLHIDSVVGVEHSQALESGCLSSATIPLILANGSTGILVVYGTYVGQFTDDVMMLINELAADLVFGINHLRSQGDALVAHLALERGLDHAIGAIASMVELRDPYTAGHQQRVTVLACAIAAEMGLPESRTQGLRLASLVHDIGKVQVPAEILAKPSRLSDAEYGIIKGHPRAAWEVLREIEFPWPVAEIVYQHHEKMDGSGYPRGLKGDEILTEARILTVADQVEAMASHRPYRPSRGIYFALQEISRQKGIQLDKDAVDACMRLFMERGFVLSGAADSAV